MSTSSESNAADHKKLKAFHPRPKRPITSNNVSSGNPAPHKKIKQYELTPYNDTDDELLICHEVMKGGSESITCGTEYDTDNSEIIQKGEKRKHHINFQTEKGEEEGRNQKTISRQKG